MFTTDAEFSSNGGDSRQVSRQTFWVGWGGEASGANGEACS